MGAAATTIQQKPTPETIHKNYLVEYQIGKGGFSDVFLSINKLDQTKVAVKRINLASALSHSRGMEALSSELQVYKRLGCHDNIVKLHYAYRLKNHFYFVMDCLLGGDLRQFVQINGGLSLQSISYIIASLGSGLHHMHERGVFHRDIKPENIAFDSNGKPYLTDFGISHLTTDKSLLSLSFMSRESSGTLPYLAPEVLTKTHEHSYQSDFWSLGVVAYELVYGRRPFDPHVPLNFIYFVANHYYKMWDLNFDDNNLPFPHYKITLNEDGSVPSSLLAPMFSTRMSPSNGCPERVSEEMIDLMRGMLDVRIPERLGSMNHFQDFSHHPSFLQYGYHISHDLQTSPSPVLKEDWSGVLGGQIRSRSFKSSPQSDIQEHFSPFIELSLEKLFYIHDGGDGHGGGGDKEEELDHQDWMNQSSKLSNTTKTQSSLPTSPGRSSYSQ